MGQICVVTEEAVPTLGYILDTLTIILHVTFKCFLVEYFINKVFIQLTVEFSR